MLLELNEPQQQALNKGAGEPLRLVDPRTNECYVLVKADVYDQIKNLVYDDDSPSDEEKRLQLAASGERAGWNDPEMDVYDDYDKNRKLLWP
ncbi:MAG TPA: hypothetical protein VE988_15385 [Gemmataceae bacterium]|nr:hypothetical protein [Gemmataceae bacterium]